MLSEVEKLWAKKYRNSIKGKLKIKEYRHKNRLKNREWQKNWILNNKEHRKTYLKEYNKRPEVKEKKYYSSNYIWRRFSARAKQVNRLDISKEQFILWYDSQISKKCFYCNLPQSALEIDIIRIKFNGNTRNKIFSIDRMDNNGLYRVDNIVLSCNRCNIFKSNFFSAEEMREISQKHIKPKWQKLLEEIKNEEVNIIRPQYC